MSERLDKEMLSRKLVLTRSQASMLIKQGDVYVNGEKVTKSGQQVSDTDKISIEERGLYVGRGAYKLLCAIEEFGLDFGEKVVVDCGASTGGFTQVALLNGASKVYALDVGHDQLDQSLVTNPKVINQEGINLKEPQKLSEKVDFCVVDLSFISLKLVYKNIHDFLKDNGKSVVLIKPQFEAGRERVGRGGIVSCENQKLILQEVIEWFKANNYNVEKTCESPIKGKAGNTEYLALIS